LFDPGLVEGEVRAPGHLLTGTKPAPSEGVAFSWDSIESVDAHPDKTVLNKSMVKTKGL
jgi:hypothetical protein